MRGAKTIDDCARRALFVCMLTLGCRSPAPPEQPPADSPEALADTAQPVSATLEECTFYTEAYCTEYWTEDDGEQRTYEELDRSEQEQVLLECENSLRGASEANRETFVRCLSCLQDCSYARRCLGREHGGMVLFFDDCSDDDAL
jgi:hypothetical protein